MTDRLDDVRVSITLDVEELSSEIDGLDKGLEDRAQQSEEDQEAAANASAGALLDGLGEGLGGAVSASGVAGAAQAGAAVGSLIRNRVQDTLGQLEQLPGRIDQFRPSGIAERLEGAIGSLPFGVGTAYRLAGVAADYGTAAITAIQEALPPGPMREAVTIALDRAREAAAGVEELRGWIDGLRGTEDDLKKLALANILAGADVPIDADLVRALQEVNATLRQGSRQRDRMTREAVGAAIGEAAQQFFSSGGN